MIAVFIVLGVLVLLCALLLVLVFPARRRHPHRALLDGAFIAHRGLHDDTLPENSLAAFQAAVKAGYIIENDIHLTADGEVVVFHDDNPRRMCGVEGRIEQMTLAELKALRLKDSDRQIPTLKECLDAVDGQVPLLIEFKCPNARTCTPLCEAADKILAEYKGLYFVQSFYPPVLRWYRRHRPDVCRGQLASAFPGEGLVKRLLGCMVFNCLSRPDFVSYEHRFAAHPCRRLVSRLGAFPVGWTFQSQEELTRHRTDFRTYIFEGFIPK